MNTENFKKCAEDLLCAVYDMEMYLENESTIDLDHIKRVEKAKTACERALKELLMLRTRDVGVK